MSLKGANVGDKVRVRSDRYDVEATVEKIGRTLATLSDGHQYEIETGQRKPKSGVVRGWGYTAFTAEALNRLELQRNYVQSVARLYESIRRGSPLQDVSNADLVGMLAQIEMMYQKIHG